MVEGMWARVVLWWSETGIGGFGGDGGGLVGPSGGLGGWGRDLGVWGCWGALRETLGGSVFEENCFFPNNFFRIIS